MNTDDVRGGSSWLSISILKVYCPPRTEVSDVILHDLKAKIAIYVYNFRLIIQETFVKEEEFPN